MHNYLGSERGYETWHLATEGSLAHSSVGAVMAEECFSSLGLGTLKDKHELGKRADLGSRGSI